MSRKAPTHSRQSGPGVIDTDEEPDPPDLAPVSPWIVLCFIILRKYRPPLTPEPCNGRCRPSMAWRVKIYRVLLTKVPAPPETDVQDVFAALVAHRIPLLTAEIPSTQSLRPGRESKVSSYLPSQIGSALFVHGVPIRGFRNADLSRIV